MSLRGKLNGAQKSNFTFASPFASVFPDLENGNNTVKGTLEWTGEPLYFIKLGITILL